MSAVKSLTLVMCLAAFSTGSALAGEQGGKAVAVPEVVWPTEWAAFGPVPHLNPFAAHVDDPARDCQSQAGASVGRNIPLFRPGVSAGAGHFHPDQAHVIRQLTRV